MEVEKTSFVGRPAGPSHMQISVSAPADGAHESSDRVLLSPLQNKSQYRRRDVGQPFILVGSSPSHFDTMS